MLRTRRVVAVAALAGVLIVRLVAQPAAQSGPTASAKNLSLWLKAIDEHVPGEFDPPAQRIAALTDDEISGVLTDLTDLLRLESVLRRQREARPDQMPRARFRDLSLTLEQIEEMFRIGSDRDVNNYANRILRRGTLLHTDIALLFDARLEVPQTTSQLSRDVRSMVLQGEDGRFSAPVSLAIHLIAGRNLMNAITPKPGEDESVRAWYYATTMIFAGRLNLGDLTPHMTQARKVLPNDPVILFFSGVKHEAQATSQVQGIAASAKADGYNVLTDAPTLEWQQARDDFRAALRWSPDSPETHLHLGRVLGQLGDHQAALAELDKAAAGLSEPDMQYYALLFQAAEYEALGQWDSARSSLARASELFPNAQSPVLATSRLAHRQGDLAGAAAALERLFQLRSTDAARDDPWWRYIISPARNYEALLDRARKLLQEDGR